MNSIFSKLDSIKSYQLVLLITLIFFTNLFEIFSISLIIPIFNILKSNNISELDTYTKYILNLFEISQYEQLMIVSSFFIITVFIFKFFLTIFTSYSIVNLTANLKVEISMKILRYYLNQKYPFFLGTNSNYLTQNVIHEPRIFSDKFFLAGIYFFSDFLMLLFILIFLLIYNLKVTLILIFFVFLLIIFYSNFTKKRVLILGQQRGEFEKKIISITKDLFHSIKEVKNYSAENFFYNSLKPKNIQNEKTYRILFLLQSIPRPSLELLSMLALFSIILMNYYFFKYENLISLLAVLAVSLFKIIPSSTRILASYQDIKFSKYSVDLIKSIFKNFEKVQNFCRIKNKLSFQNHLELKNISFKYLNSKKNIFNNINLKIKKGDFIGIVGSSGSGKSTLIDIILGLQSPQSGDIFIDNHVFHDQIFSRPDLFGYVPQKIFLFNDSIKQNIALGVPQYQIDDKSVIDALRKVNLFDHFEQSQGLNTEINEMGLNLSGGQVQRIGIARCLYFNSQILIFDESTNQLDKENEEIILKLINDLSKQKTIIFVSHKLENLKNCNRILEVKNGELNEKN